MSPEQNAAAAAFLNRLGASGPCSVANLLRQVERILQRDAVSRMPPPWPGVILPQLERAWRAADVHRDLVRQRKAALLARIDAAIAHVNLEGGRSANALAGAVLRYLGTKSACHPRPSRRLIAARICELRKKNHVVHY